MPYENLDQTNTFFFFFKKEEEEDLDTYIMHDQQALCNWKGRKLETKKQYQVLKSSTRCYILNKKDNLFKLNYFVLYNNIFSIIFHNTKFYNNLCCICKMNVMMDVQNSL